MNKQLYGFAGVLATLSVVLALTMAIDWSSFTDAITAVLPDIVALAAAVVGVIVTIAVVMKAVPYIGKLVTRFMH